MRERARPFFQHRQHRQRERRRFAGAGLRDAQYVAPGEHVRNGLILYRGGGFLTGSRDGG